MLDRIGFTLISAAIAITVIAFARNKTPDLKTDLSIAALPGGLYNTSIARRASASLYEQDTLDRESVLISVADPLVIRAGEYIRNAFNAQRKKTCKSMKLYNSRGVIQYAKKAVETDGTVLYTLEIVFDNAAVFARVALLPNNADAKFNLVLSIPSPCDGEIQEQLAVSSLGTLIHLCLASPLEQTVLTLNHVCDASRQPNQQAEAVLDRFAQLRVRRGADKAVRPRIQSHLR